MWEHIKYGFHTLKYYVKLYRGLPGRQNIWVTDQNVSFYLYKDTVFDESDWYQTVAFLKNHL